VLVQDSAPTRRATDDVETELTTSLFTDALYGLQQPN